MRGESQTRPTRFRRRTIAKPNTSGTRGTIGITANVIPSCLDLHRCERGGECVPRNRGGTAHVTKSLPAGLMRFVKHGAAELAHGLPGNPEFCFKSWSTREMWPKSDRCNRHWHTVCFAVPRIGISRGRGSDPPADPPEKRVTLPLLASHSISPNGATQIPRWVAPHRLESRMDVPNRTPIRLSAPQVFGATIRLSAARHARPRPGNTRHARGGRRVMANGFIPRSAPRSDVVVSTREATEPVTVLDRQCVITRT
jgi:hypothetical protein